MQVGFTEFFQQVGLLIRFLSPFRLQNSFIELSYAGGVARNFLESGSNSSKMSANMVGRGIKCWVAEQLKR